MASNPQTTKPYEEISEEDAKAIGISPWKLSEETKKAISQIEQAMIYWRPHDCI